jgi:anti-sigma-K factor RskA
MTHEELEDAVPLYAVGALERVERQALEAHLLSGCVSCHTALKEYQSTAALLPFGLTKTAPPRSLKAKIMAARNASAVTAEPTAKQSPKPSLEPGEWMNHLFPPESSSRPLSFGWALGFAAVAILAVGGYLAWTSYQQFTAENTKLQQLQAQAEATASKLASLQQQLTERDRSLSQLRDELQRRASDLAELKDQLIQRETELDEVKTLLAQRGSTLRAHTPSDELAALMRTPNVKAVALTGSDRAKGAAGFLLYDPRTQKVWLYSVNLPECPNGTTYQLWAIHEKPISVGTFHMDSGETAHLLVKQVPDFTAAKKFAVSLEPSGGRPQPTGPIYLISQS